ncbi:MAG: hypothetical protein H6734_02565 [Alphaproteobacteria bacterium]|nr:hypothetical protein [Alphaproteobacteria bacterium]
MRAGLILLVGCAGGPTEPTEPPGPAGCPEFEAGAALGTVPTPPATELSGIAASSDGRYLVHNDSGEPAEVHVLGPDGAHLGTWSLTGVDAVDFEDIAIGTSPLGDETVYVGDIGDNLSRRTEGVQVYRFALPAFDDGPVTAERLDLVWPDGPRDAESLWIDDQGALWLADKQVDGNTGLYQVRLPMPGINALQRMTSLQLGEPPLGDATQVTAGDFGPRGLVLRTYLQTAFVWPRNPGESVLDALANDVCAVGLLGEGQGEGIAWTPDGLVTVSEGDTPALNLVPFAP